MTSDRRRVRTLVLQDRPVDPRDLGTAMKLVADANRFHPFWIVLTALAVVLLLTDMVLSVVSDSWHWLALASPPLLMLAGAISLRDHRRAQRWAAHHLDAAG